MSIILQIILCSMLDFQIVSIILCFFEWFGGLLFSSLHVLRKFSTAKRLFTKCLASRMKNMKRNHGWTSSSVEILRYGPQSRLRNSSCYYGDNVTPHSHILKWKKNTVFKTVLLTCKFCNHPVPYSPEGCAWRDSTYVKEWITPLKQTSMESEFFRKWNVELDLCREILCESIEV